VFCIPKGEKRIMEMTMTAITGKEDQGDLSTPYQDPELLEQYPSAVLGKR
jgi:hypothetical protein